MKTKKEEPKAEELPLLVRNVILMREYPNLFAEKHWDLFIGSMRMIFNEFPEIDKYMNSHHLEEKDQKYFIYKLEDLMSLRIGEI